MIIAAADRQTREALRAKLLAVGLPCDEEVTSVADLKSSLAAGDPEDTTLVVVGTADRIAEGRLALQLEVPVLSWPMRAAAARDTAARAVARALTARERQILALVAAGTSNKGIARELSISPNTVKFHLAALFLKLGVATRAEALAAAARAGELSL